MANPIWVVVEHSGGQIQGSSLEALNAAMGLGQEVSAVVLGHQVQEVAEAAAKAGVQVLHLDHEALAPYNTVTWVHALSAMAQAHSPKAILMSHGLMARDLAARLAARLSGAVITDCTKVSADGDDLLVERPLYAGKLLAKAKVTGSGTKVVTLRGKSYDKAPAKDGGSVEAVSAEFEPCGKCRVQDFVAAGGGAVSLTEADIVVSAGRGIGAPENFQVVEDLAGVLGAAVGASRAVVDAGWREHASQVGQTGKVVNPNLYFACGISGAIQHLVGMQNSKTIVAINKDADAPIFKKADYGIVGDLFEVVPALTSAFKEAQGS